MKEKKDFPAFPQAVSATEDGDRAVSYDFIDASGMGLRDYFAAKAMQAIISMPNKDGRLRGKKGVKTITKYAYEYADEMMKARNE